MQTLNTIEIDKIHYVEMGSETLRDWRNHYDSRRDQVGVVLPEYAKFNRASTISAQITWDAGYQKFVVRFFRYFTKRNYGNIFSDEFAPKFMVDTLSEAMQAAEKIMPVGTVLCAARAR